jgi:hypothetical protein
MLISPPHIPGPDLSIEDFCSLYDLDTDISEHFKQQKFKFTNTFKFKCTKTFKFIELSDLKEMGFFKGGIAELKVAIKVWSQVPE